MQVNNTNLYRSALVAQTNHHQTKTQAKAERAPEFSEANELESALHESPEIRPEVVQRAAKLIESNNYPPPEMIRRLARLFAQPRNLSGE